MVVQRTASMPSRPTKGSTGEDGTFVFPRYENPRRSIGYQEKTAKRETPRRENDADSTGDIVFPNDEGSLHRPPQSFTPGPAPECKTKTYCEKTAFYPENYVSTVIREHDDLKMLAVVDAVDYIAQRIDVDDSTPLCTAEEQLVYPTAAQNRANNWLFVVNQEGFRQGVRVETCQTDEGECAVISGWAFGYRSICKQKYILRQLTAISPNGTVIRDMFRLPSSCCCQVKLESTYNSRIGINQSSDDQTSTPAAKRRKR
ncbi:protein spaetzle-like [Athalia rosae]|uniref:protein spaetzle-like n=1 Tax=Athalia rosae TaxID=37344 RepID=UPI002033A6F2|nr:protein spaetzle-like [Athalia rosae]